MAIQKDESLSNDAENVFRINNGDLQALKKLQDQWDFKDIESVIAFAVGVLRQADGSRRILVQPEGSSTPSPVSPNSSLLKEDAGTQE